MKPPEETTEIDTAMASTMNQPYMTQTVATDLITEWMRMSNSNTTLTMKGDEMFDWMAMTTEEMIEVLNQETLTPALNTHQMSPGKNLIKPPNQMMKTVQVTSADFQKISKTTLTSPLTTALNGCLQEI